jgi:hypothetical protein
MVKRKILRRKNVVVGVAVKKPKHTEIMDKRKGMITEVKNVGGMVVEDTAAMETMDKKEGMITEVNLVLGMVVDTGEDMMLMMMILSLENLENSHGMNEEHS